MLYGTPIDNGEFSDADDPRVLVEKVEVPTAAISRSIMPFVYIAGVSSAIEFYKRVFDASVLMRHEEPSGIVSHATLKIGETTVMLSDPTSEDVSKNDMRACRGRRSRTAVRRCICMCT